MLVKDVNENSSPVNFSGVIVSVMIAKECSRTITPSRNRSPLALKITSISVCSSLKCSIIFCKMAVLKAFDGCCKENRSEEHTSELQSRGHLVCRLLLEKKNAYMCRHDLAMRHK